MYGNNNAGIGSGIGNPLKILQANTCNFSYNFTSTILGTPVNIPTVESASAEFSYTIQSSYFPTLTGEKPASIENIGFVLAGCSNTSVSSARTLNWRVKRNGASIGTGSQSVPAGNKATLNASILVANSKPAVNDLIEVFLWCSESDADMQLNRYAMGIVPTRFKAVADPFKLLFKTSVNTTYNVGVSGFSTNATLYNRQGYKMHLSGLSYLTNTTISLLFDAESPTYGLYTLQGDSTASNNVKIHATSYLYEPHVMPTSISWRETNINYR